MAFAVGYNLQAANELMEKIAEAYKNLGIYTSDQWGAVVNALQTNWVGTDEQDYELKLAERICEMYINSYNLVDGALTTIVNLGDTWIEFQSKNTIDGGVSEAVSKNKLSKPSVSRNDKIVEQKKRTITNNEDRGLSSDTSATNIKTAVSEFVGQIKAKTEGLFQEIETSNAFFGEQSTTIKSYIEKVGDAVGEVTIAVKDMYNALDILAKSSYTSASSTVSDEFVSATSAVDAKLDDLKETRWS